jgi:membrane protease YdiL (CAAX protease family)
VGPALALAALAVLLPAALALTPARGVWPRLGLSYVVLVPAAVLGVRIGSREIARPTRWRLAGGLAAAAALIGLTWVASGLLARFPAFAALTATVAGWIGQLPAPAALAMLAFIVAGEEIVRAAVTFPLAARLGPWTGAAAAGLLFAAAHLSFGIALLPVAAFALGTLWSAIDLKTRSLVPSLVCHLLWDLAVLFAGLLG